MVAKIQSARVLALTVGDLIREVEGRRLDGYPVGSVRQDGKWSQGARIKLGVYDKHSREFLGWAEDLTERDLANVAVGYGFVVV